MEQDEGLTEAFSALVKSAQTPGIVSAIVLKWLIGYVARNGNAAHMLADFKTADLQIELEEGNKIMEAMREGIIEGLQEIADSQKT